MAKPVQNAGCVLATQEMWKQGREAIADTHCRLWRSRDAGRRRREAEPMPTPKLHSVITAQQASVRLSGCLRMVRVWILSNISL